MKKFMFIIGITISLFTMTATAGQTRAEVLRWNHESILNGRERTPVFLPTVEYGAKVNELIENSNVALSTKETMKVANNVAVNSSLYWSIN